jgi:hypothetical protein
MVEYRLKNRPFLSTTGLETPFCSYNSLPYKQLFRTVGSCLNAPAGPVCRLL